VFDNKEVLGTGGLGFIGSNLCIKLVELGARVTIIDNILPRQGGNLFNIRDIADRVTVNVSDVRNQLSMNHLVKGMDYIFHLAGQVNHVDSMKNPLQDLEINTGTLVLLEALRHHNGTPGSSSRARGANTDRASSCPSTRTTRQTPRAFTP
jgi:nucleoside-diphosphate-sugar epimerase